MLTWERVNRDAAIEASNLHGFLDLSIDRPIDVYAAIERLGIVLAFTPMDTCSGVYIPAIGPESLPGILIHQGHPRSRQRYTASHELGHHIFGHEIGVDADLGGGYSSTKREDASDDEKQAEAFASWFLMPRRLLRAGVRELQITLRNPVEVYALSLWLGTSFEATINQLEVTRIIESKTASEWRSVKPRSIKLGLLGDNSMNLRSDVWWVDRTTMRNPIDVQPGDRIILHLPENATTGYSWTPVNLPSLLEIESDSFTDWWEPSRGSDAVPSDPELVGQTTMRSMLFSVSRSSTHTVFRLSLNLIQPWRPDDPEDHYEALISVTPLSRGARIDPEQLVIGL